MNAHKTQAVIASNGKLEVFDLPFEAGSHVEVIVLAREMASTKPTFPLRGSFGVMHKPFEPAVEVDAWDALR